MTYYVGMAIVLIGWCFLGWWAWSLVSRLMYTYMDIRRLNQGDRMTYLLDGAQHHGRFPTAAQLLQEPSLGESQNDSLRAEYTFGPYFAGVRFWVSRGTTADGQPYDNTVTIEVQHYLIRKDSPTGWHDLHQYDGDNPPSSFTTELDGEPIVIYPGDLTAGYKEIPHA